MFSINDYIIYGNTGVCKIVDIKNIKFGSKPERKYYVIKPIYEDKSTIYAPVDNTTINIRPIMTREDLKELIKVMPDQNTIWIEDCMIRKEKYTEIIKEGNRKELVKLIKTLYFHKKKQAEIGKKLIVNDETLMKEAERILNQELALILDIDIKEVVPFIAGELSKSFESKVEDL